MNLFLLSSCPVRCARYHVDRHVVKMILETAQLLCTAHHVTRSSFAPPMRATHRNHPCAVWVRASRSNYVWACALGLALCAEYTHRYDRVHKTEAHLRKLTENVPSALPALGPTPPPQAMPACFRVPGKTVLAYRRYYAQGKRHLFTWTRRPPPPFLAAHVATSNAPASRAAHVVQ